MSIRLKTLLIAGAVCISAAAFEACKKDKVATGIDKSLYDMATASSGFTWFKNSADLLPKSAGSGHPQPYLKTRYNAIAATQLDSVGRIKSNAVFTDGSLIVKELYNSTSELGRYAILYKDAKNENADAKGWVWGYINAKGDVEVSAGKKGEACISCHSQGNNIDYMLMNKYFP